jgi:Na+/phosphate symporter
MILSGFWPILLMLAGAAIYIFATRAQLVELGRILFAAGAFAFAFFVAGRTFAI